MRDEHDTDIQEVGGTSPEFRTQLAKQLEELVPEAIADGKVDVQKLKELLSEDASDTNERFGLFWPGKKACHARRTRLYYGYFEACQRTQQRLGFYPEYLYRGR